jgi:hypothetical protein
MLIGKGFTDHYLTEAETGEIVAQALESLQLDGKRVLIIIPDGTRTMPMPLMFNLFEGFLGPRVKTMNYLVALGTHQPMNDARLPVVFFQFSLQNCSIKLTVTQENHFCIFWNHLMNLLNEFDMGIFRRMSFAAFHYNPGYRQSPATEYHVDRQN